MKDDRNITDQRRLRCFRFSLAVLLIFAGCGKGSKMQQVQEGARIVDQHAKEIEKAAKVSDRDQ